MKASDSEDGAESDADEEGLNYEELFSVLMYYGNMSKKDILQSSRPFLLNIYKQYVRRASENLGVSPDGEAEDTHSYVRESPLDESDYPVQFKKLSQIEKERAVAQYESDADFMSKFIGM